MITWKQFWAMEQGFIESYFKIDCAGNKTKELLSKLFFKNCSTSSNNQYNRVGGGKTLCARYIETLSVPLYIADEEAKSHHGID
jgi:hypothetical protein